MWLIVGLGNPGTQYAQTRHNIGFMAVDMLFSSLRGPSWGQEHKAYTAKLKWDGEQILLAKPQTFMNLSGQSVQALLHFYKIPQNQLLVIQDDIDQAFGSMKFQKSRGHGGHNGIKSISELLGTTDYSRLKLGVGRPLHPSIEIADYVLQKFSQEEQNQLTEILNRAGDAIETLIFQGFGKASSLFNKTV